MVQWLLSYFITINVRSFCEVVSCIAIHRLAYVGGKEAFGDELSMVEKQELEGVSLADLLQQYNKQKSSKYFGVSWDKNGGKWRSFLKSSGKFKFLPGYFGTEEEAARCYDAAAYARYGRFALCNTPELNFLLTFTICYCLFAVNAHSCKVCAVCAVCKFFGSSIF